MDGLEGLTGLFTNLFNDGVGSLIAVSVIIIIMLIAMLAYIGAGIDIILGCCIMLVVGLTYIGFIPNLAGIGMAMVVAAFILYRYYSGIMQ